MADLGIKIDSNAGSYTNISTMGLLLTDYRVPSAPAKKIVGVDMAGAHGLYPVSGVYSSGNVDIGVTVTDTSVTAVQTKLTTFFSWLHTLGTRLRLQFSDTSTYFRKVVFSSADDIKITEGVDSCTVTFRIIFVMYDPFIYTSALTLVSTEIWKSPSSNTTSYTHNNTGLQTPCDIITSSVAIDETKYNTIVSGGTFPAGMYGYNFPVVTVNGVSCGISQNVPVATNPTTYEDKYYLFDSTNFNTRRYTARYNQYFEGEFINLVSGNNVVSFSCLSWKLLNAEPITEGRAYVTLAYNRRWL